MYVSLKLVLTAIVHKYVYKGDHLVIRWVIRFQSMALCWMSLSSKFLSLFGSFSLSSRHKVFKKSMYKIQHRRNEPFVSSCFTNPCHIKYCLAGKKWQACLTSEWGNKSYYALLHEIRSPLIMKWWQKAIKQSEFGCTVNR